MKVQRSTGRRLKQNQGVLSQIGENARGRVIHRQTRPVAKVVSKSQRIRKRNAIASSSKDYPKLARELAVIAKNNEKPVIVIERNLGGIGDVLMSTPLLRGLKEKYPNIHLVYATEPNYSHFYSALFDILKYNPYIDELVDYRTYDFSKCHLRVNITCPCLVFEKPYSEPPNRIDIFCQSLNVRPSSFVPVYIVDEKESNWADEVLTKYLSDYKSKNLICIIPETNTHRRNTDMSVMREAAALLTQNDNTYCIVLSHIQDKWNQKKVIEFRGYGIREAAAVMDKCDLVIAPDTGGLHLAGALRKKIVGLFGSTFPSSRISRYAEAIAICKGKAVCAKFPCWYDACDKNFACIKAITPKDIADTTMNLLERPVSASSFAETGDVFRSSVDIIIPTINNSNGRSTRDLMVEIEKNTHIPHTVNTAQIDKMENYSKICNRTIKKGKGDYVLLLNRNTRISDSLWLEKMLQSFFDNKFLGITGPEGAFLSPDYETISHTNNKVSCDYIPGWCAMFPRSLFEKVGGLDEVFSSDFLDIDLSLRIIRHGFDVETTEGVNVAI